MFNFSKHFMGNKAAPPLLLPRGSPGSFLFDDHTYLESGMQFLCTLG